MQSLFSAVLAAFTILFASSAFAQNKSDDTKDQPLFSNETFKSMAFRSIGPAYMSGRIADIAVDQTNPSTWYVAVGSGGVWKTNNAGTTWSPIFDQESVYSIGALAVDPRHPERLWVGTGENVGGRHASFGDGLYKSNDGGASWENVGLALCELFIKFAQCTVEFQN